jgi:hypothetical protein
MGWQISQDILASFEAWEEWTPGTTPLLHKSSWLEMRGGLPIEVGSCCPVPLSSSVGTSQHWGCNHHESSCNWSHGLSDVKFLTTACL